MNSFSKKKILFICQNFWPEPFRSTDIADCLHEAGFDIEVLTGLPSYPKGKIFENYSFFSVGSEKSPKGYTVYRVPTFPRGNNSKIRIILNYLSFIIFGCLFGSYFLRKKKFDLIMVFAPSPIFQSLVGIFFKKFKKIKLITWVQDLWPESLEATGTIKNKLILGIIKVFVKWTYHKNDYLLAQSKSFEESIKLIANKIPIAYCPNIGELLLEKQNLNYKIDVKLEKNFNVIFAGNLGKAQSLNTIIEAADILKNHEDISFGIFGDGSAKNQVKEKIKKLNLKNIKLYGSYEAKYMPDLYSKASVLLVSLKKNTILSKTIPGKLQSYLNTGKPIIASLDGEGSRIIIESKAGFACEAENAKMLAEKVLNLYSKKPEELIEIGKSGKKYYKEHFSSEVILKKINGVFEKLK